MNNLIKVQELNEDGSVRLDDLGEPICQFWTAVFFSQMQDTKIGRERWKRVPEQTKMPEYPKRKTAPQGD